MQNVSIKGFIYAALSSATFGLAPFFTISLLLAGFSSFKVLAYRWGNSFTYLGRFRHYAGRDIPHQQERLGTVFILSLLRAATSFSPVIAYQNIASGVASTIHFMYPLAVAPAMMGFFGEKRSFAILFAVLVSLSGAGLLSSGKIDFEGGNTTIGLIAAGLSVFFLWRIYRRSKEEPCRADSLHCIDMLRNGAGSLVLYYRRISDRRHPAGQ